MIYPNNNPVEGGHKADNRLLSANITSHYAWVNDEWVQVLDTTLDPDKRDNYLMEQEMN